MRRKRSVQLQIPSLAAYDTALIMQGVCSIPAVIEVCAMKRMCTEYHMDNPIIISRSTSGKKMRRQSFRPIRAKCPLKPQEFSTHGNHTFSHNEGGGGT